MLRDLCYCTQIAILKITFKQQMWLFYGQYKKEVGKAFQASRSTQIKEKRKQNLSEIK